MTVGFITGLLPIAIYFATNVSSDYNMNQFLPRNHPLLTADHESKKVFHISEASPHIVLLSLSKNSKGEWHDQKHLEGLVKLTAEIEKQKTVKSVVSLGNIQSAFEQKRELVVGTLSDLRKQGFKIEQVLNDPLYSPNLISKDGRHTAVFVMPGSLSQEQHSRLSSKLVHFSKKYIPDATVQLGGPAAIRTQLIDLLSRELMLFIFLSLIGSMAVVKLMFHGWVMIPRTLLVLVVANILTLGLMGWLGMSINILSSTLPIIVTVTALGISNHTMVRMAQGAHLPPAERMVFMKTLMLELLVPHFLTASSTAAGYACLIPSDVALISDYGKIVALGVLVSALSALMIVPNFLLWTRLPKPREFLQKSQRFSYFLVRKAHILTPVIGVAVVLFAAVGMDLSWTARMFDDLPANHQAARTTRLISQKLGGVATLDFMVGTPKSSDTWKEPNNIKKLHAFARQWREHKDVGSVLSIADFLAMGESREKLPAKRAAIAELQFLYGMSGESPLKQFLSSDEKWTRIAVRLPDLPAAKNKMLIAKMTQDLKRDFPNLQVKASGFAAIVPTINDDISKQLMWGFFEALFWIVLILSIVLRSLKWGLIAILPNLVPPAVLIGLMALFNIDIKPGIAIIFAISLGMSFDNTVYILLRLKYVLRSRKFTTRLPIYSLMKRETMPCLVSSAALMAGFSIFLFSMFPVNKLFGAFMLIALTAGLVGDLIWLPVLLKRFPWMILEKGEGYMFFEKLSLRWRRVAHYSPYLILILLGLFAFRYSYALEVKDVLRNVESRTAPPNERVQIKMIIQEADGAKKERQLTILRKNEGEARALIRLQKPSDLKGLTLLTVSEGGKEDQWLYLPSDKKSRRILGSNKKGKFLDSEIAFEDLRISTYKEFDNKILKDDGKVIQIESKAKPDTESSYGKILTWVTKADYKIEKVDYYDQNGKLWKQMKFTKYEKIGDKFWRARQVNVTNVQDKRKTALFVQKVSLKAISDDEVSLAALEE
jgi:predicted RND superfamily exporter protein